MYDPHQKFRQPCTDQVKTNLLVPLTTKTAVQKPANSFEIANSLFLDGRCSRSLGRFYDRHGGGRSRNLLSGPPVYALVNDFGFFKRERHHLKHFGFILVAFIFAVVERSSESVRLRVRSSRTISR